MAHARGKHRPLRGTPETTCHPAQARVGSLTDGLSARCRTPNDVHRRRKGRNTWLDRGGAAVADCRGRRPHAPLSPLFPAPNLPAFPPPAKCSRADTIRVTQPVSPAAPRSVPSSGPNPHDRTRPESPRRNRASTGVSRRLSQYPHASECCQACAGRRAAVPRSTPGHSGAVRSTPLGSHPRVFSAARPWPVPGPGDRGGAAWASRAFPHLGAPDFRCNSCDRTNRYTLMPDRHRTLEGPVD